jgi:uncharacterized protein (TIGR03086 family)
VEKFDLLAAAYAEVERRLVLISPEQWNLPTPCDEWDVRGLVNHIVTSNTTGTMLLHGASREETAAIIGDYLLGDDPIEAFTRTAAEQAAAFRAPGVLEQVVHHPALDMSGMQLLDFRIGDNAIHEWDLARAIHADEALDLDLVTFVWNSLEPISDPLVASGAFGAGVSAEVDADAPLQTRLLDLCGRRP